MASKLARDNGYPDEMAFYLCALIKSRNGNIQEAQEILSKGKKLKHFVLKFNRNSFLFVQGKWL